MFTYNRLRLYGIRKQNHRLEMMVDERTNSLLQTNKELLQREEEIQTQNEELLRREEEIRAQNEELHEQREELELANQELLRQQEALAAQNEELMQSEEEISTQRDLVSAQNAELEQARQKIEEQNKEIVLRNETLESEVALRTKDVVEYNQQLEQFAFISAHNLRAPVARILGLGQIFEFANDDRDQERMILDKMVVTTKELDRVVRDLNTILEIRKDNTSVITEIDLAEELRLVKINLEREIEETRTQILVDFSAGNMVYTIKPYLDSILINLISNAIKYRHKSRRPVIEVRSFVTPEYFCLIVKDNGMGIDLKLYKDKLFTLYSRFHDHVEGKGMGLYLVKTQVSALGGRIDVESEVNEGVTFRIYLKRK
jgi:signal transduction histidine kinase